MDKQILCDVLNGLPIWIYINRSGSTHTNVNSVRETDIIRRLHKI